MAEHRLQNILEDVLKHVSKNVSKHVSKKVLGSVYIPLPAAFCLVEKYEKGDAR